MCRIIVLTGDRKGDIMADTGIKCFIAQLKPFDVKDREDVAVLEFQKNSISNGICGMGYGIPSFFCDKEHISLDYETLTKYKNAGTYKGTSFPAALNRYYEMDANNCFIFTRCMDSVCYIGKVTSKAYHDSNKCSFPNYENYSWIVDVDWKFIGDFTNIPSPLRGVLSSPRQKTIYYAPSEMHSTIIRICYENDMNSMLSSNEKSIITSENFHFVLDSFGLEDLVYFYMKEKNPNYLLMPSSCKPSEPMIEFVMSNYEKRITCQVKSNARVDADKYRKLSQHFETIYLFSGVEVINTENMPGNIEIIEREELFELFKSEFNKPNSYFSNMLGKYFRIE